MAMGGPTTFPSRLWTMVMLLGMNQDMLMQTLFSYTPLSSICPSGGPYAGSAPPGEGPSLTTITQNSQNTLSYIYIPNHNPTLLQFPQSYGYGYGYDFQYSYVYWHTSSNTTFARKPHNHNHVESHSHNHTQA